MVEEGKSLFFIFLYWVSSQDFQSRFMMMNQCSPLTRGTGGSPLPIRPKIFLCPHLLKVSPSQEWLRYLFDIRLIFWQSYVEFGRKMSKSDEKCWGLVKKCLKCQVWSKMYKSFHKFWCFPKDKNAEMYVCCLY